MMPRCRSLCFDPHHVEFIDRPASSKAREKLQVSLDKAFEKGNVEWRTWRIDADEASVVDEGA